MSAAASEAYCNGIFSVCGVLCAAKRNRMSTNITTLEMDVVIKLNEKTSDKAQLLTAHSDQRTLTDSLAV